MTGQRVTIVGMARSGQAAAQLALRLGAEVTCVDRRPDAVRVPGTRAVYGQDALGDIVGAELVVVSPGVPASQPALVAAVEAGVRVVGELAFAAEHLAGVPIYAVSGTNGKSTTTHLLGQLLMRSGRRPFVGGNLGVPLSDAVGGAWDCVAVEVSSYQMEFPGTFHPRAAAILNLTPDHLDRHKTMDVYGAHKCRMFAQMVYGEKQILPAKDARLERICDMLPGDRLWLGGSPGVRVDGAKLRVEGVQGEGWVSLEGFELPGGHNAENLGAAVLLTVCAGVPTEQIDVRGLEGLPHRMQVVAERDGVRWINDSKATNIESTLVALRALRAPAVVLLGGRGKAGADYERLAGPLRGVRGVLCFGEAGPAIAESLARAGVVTHVSARLADAVEHAAALAERGDVVLLSPACASFDAFTDYEHRGVVFARHVQELP